MRKQWISRPQMGVFLSRPQARRRTGVASHHAACDGDTRVRLPEVVPSRAVRRGSVSALRRAVRAGSSLEAARMARMLPVALGRSIDVSSLSWRWLSLAVWRGSAAVVAGSLVALQGGDAGRATAAGAARDARRSRAGGAGCSLTPVRATGGGNAAPIGLLRRTRQLISESTFQLALPPGWKRDHPSGGATFAAVAPGGEADVMLWIEEDPKLDFASFEARSLDQLESLAGSAGVVERNPVPPRRRPRSRSRPPPRRRVPRTTRCCSARAATTGTTSRPPASRARRPRPRTESPSCRARSSRREARADAAHADHRALTARAWRPRLRVRRRAAAPRGFAVGQRLPRRLWPGERRDRLPDRRELERVRRRRLLHGQRDEGRRLRRRRRPGRRHVPLDLRPVRRPRYVLGPGLAWGTPSGEDEPEVLAREKSLSTADAEGAEARPASIRPVRSVRRRP